VTVGRWDRALPLREQSGFAEHAAFMDALVAEGAVALGDPLADERRVVLAVNAESEQAARERFQLDPGMGSHLSIAGIERWTIVQGVPDGTGCAGVHGGTRARPVPTLRHHRIDP
jgi:hypothetical protein